MMEYLNPQIDFSPVQITVDEAWFLVFTAVILALGAIVVLGCAVWCMSNGHGGFTGSFSFKDFGLKINLECTN